MLSKKIPIIFKFKCSNFIFQLTYLYKETDHHALSKDVDVAIWQDYRAYKCLDSVVDATDFIVINNQQHDEFDEFKKTKIMSYISYLKMN